MLSSWLDFQYGHTVTDHGIYRAYAQQYETEFFKDMRLLNVRDPDIITHTSQYIPEIKKMIQKIIDNGHAYEVNGSVYFNVPKFNNKAALKEGLRDFALWKKSRPNEPGWESRWGYGRPGWHIGCSLIASHVLGDNIDIHTGGRQLKLQHHANVMAQSCAYHGNRSYIHKHWVNYWFLSGYILIHQIKMSDLHNNVVTIREALERNSVRQIRLLFLLQSWHKQINYSNNNIIQAVKKESQIMEFFLMINAMNRKYDSKTIIAGNKADLKLNQHILRIQSDVDKALRDNFDYVTVMDILLDGTNAKGYADIGLIAYINGYLNPEKTNEKHDESERVPNILLLNKAARFVNRMLKIFGVIASNETSFLGYKHMETEKYLTSILDLINLYTTDLDQLYENKMDWNTYSNVAIKYHDTITRLKLDSEEVEEKKYNENGKNDKYESKSVNFRRKQKLIKVLKDFHNSIQYLLSLNTDSSQDIIEMTDKLRDKY